jgi:phosphatidylglycerophosphate synthase
MGESAYDRDDLTEAWSALHRGLRPSPLVRHWLALMWMLARPLVAARVPPAAVTVAGVVLAVDALLFAARLPLVALALILAAALCDGLDGAVALLQGRITRAGAFADTIADRIADTAFALAMWQAGAPLWLAGLAAALSIGLEFARRRPLITVAERPTRVICAALACVSAAVSDATWPPTVCAAVWVAATLIAFGQLARS